MHYNISFPNLGIYLDHVGKSISIFGFSIAYYGMIIGAAILIGFLIATVVAKRTGQNPEDYLDMGIARPPSLRLKIDKRLSLYKSQEKIT